MNQRPALQGSQLLLHASAVIFDVDGTLVDSVDFHAEAWRRAFAHFGFQFDFAAIRSQIGKGGDQLLPEFLSPEDVDRSGKAIEIWRGELFKRDYIDRVRGFPEVAELFRALVDAGITVALGSSAKSDELQAYKKAAGIEEFDLVETSADDAERSKPHPDIFNAALGKLGLRADEVMVVGDSPFDVEAARKAGISTVGLLCGGVPEASLLEAGAVAIYRDPAHLLQEFQNSVRQGR